MYTYYFDHSKPYSNRHEKRLYNPDGSEAAPMLITRYTFGYKWRTRGVTGPRGGKARQERKFNVFYRGGVFYKNKNIVSEDGKKLNSFETFEGILHDAFPTSSKKQGVPIVTIETVEGIPVSVKDSEGIEVWTYGDNIATLEDMLHIPEQDRAIPETESEPSIVEAASAIIQAEAARLAWIESTTPKGQQIDLFAYAGYGDNSWQELAYQA